MTCKIRAIRVRDVPRVLAIEWEAFPDDPWTSATGKGWLARMTRDGRCRHAARLARLIRSARIHQAIGLAKLIRLLVLDQPPDLSYIVAEAEDGEIAGYACLCASAGEASIPMIAVRPARQGQKIGTDLLMSLIDMAAVGGYGHISLCVRADNHGARRLYRRTGFAEVGIRPGFYQPSGTDAVMMRLAASGPARPMERQASGNNGWRHGDFR